MTRQTRRRGSCPGTPSAPAEPAPGPSGGAAGEAAENEAPPPAPSLWHRIRVSGVQRRSPAGPNRTSAGPQGGSQSAHGPQSEADCALAVREMRIRSANTFAVLMSGTGSLFTLAYVIGGFPTPVPLTAGCFCAISGLTPLLNHLLRHQPTLQAWVPLLVLWLDMSVLLPLLGCFVTSHSSYTLCFMWGASVVGLLSPSLVFTVLVSFLNAAAFYLVEQLNHDDHMRIVDWSQYPAGLYHAHNLANIFAFFGLLAIMNVLSVREHARVQSGIMKEVVAVKDAEGEQKLEFLAVMSHELRTPLSGIIGLAELLDDSPTVRTIQQSSLTLLAIINDILDFSKLRLGHMKLQTEEMDPAALAKETARALRALAADKGLELVVDVKTTGGLLVTADPHRLRQVLNNLVGNAIKFTSAGRVTLELSLTPTEALRYSVTDTGEGIAEASLRTIFDPFSQLESSAKRRFDGTGLGLAICKRLVDAMGGDLVATSTLGEGSSFVAEIPLALTYGTGGSTISPSPSVSPRAALQVPPGFDVLVVEDNLVNQKLAQRQLRLLGVTEVRVAGDGSVAVHMFRQRRPSLILMDCHMPVMDGYEATATIRGLPGGESLPIVALTADIFARKKILDAGMDEQLIKPVRLGDLCAMLKKFSPVPGTSVVLG